MAGGERARNCSENIDVIWQIADHLLSCTQSPKLQGQGCMHAVPGRAMIISSRKGELQEDKPRGPDLTPGGLHKACYVEPSEPTTDGDAARVRPGSRDELRRAELRGTMYTFTTVDSTDDGLPHEVPCAGGDGGSGSGSGSGRGRGVVDLIKLRPSVVGWKPCHGLDTAIQRCPRD